MANITLTKQDKEKESRICVSAFLIAIAISALLAVCFASPCLSGSSRQGTVVLQSRINPNHADISSLTRLPGIGTVKATAIAAYRDNTNSTPFTNAQDLQKIKGVGPKTVEKISQWLTFE